MKNNTCILNELAGTIEELKTRESRSDEIWGWLLDELGDDAIRVIESKLWPDGVLDHEAADIFVGWLFAQGSETIEAFDPIITRLAKCGVLTITPLQR